MYTHNFTGLKNILRPVTLLTLLVAGFIQNYALGEIKVLCTAALINNQYEMRKQEYINCLQKLSVLGYQPIVVESCIQGPTFLDNYATVFYSRTNNPQLRNKGVNEAISILSSFNHFNFQDNDMIIKLTGRYLFYSDQFFKDIENSPNTDIFVKEFSDGQIFTGCFAIRFKLLKEFLTHINYIWMEQNMINIEQLFADYVNRCISNNIKVQKLSTLDLRVNFFGTGKCQLLDF